jgi:RHS repeat-associated protein
VAVQTQVSGGVESDFRYYVFGNTIDEVLVMHDGTGDLYYAHDHLYSPVALFAANGTVVERYEYDVYGKVHILAPNYELRTASLYGNPYAFTGRELDILDAGSCKLYHYRHRDYNPDLGRFLQQDPLMYVDGLNHYLYVKNQPTMASDPLGLYYSTTSYPDNIGGISIRCITRADGPTMDHDNSWGECNKIDNFVTWAALTVFAAELPPVWIPISGYYATCCKCEMKFSWKETPIQEWFGRYMINHGFFGIGRNRYHAVDFQGVGPVEVHVSNVKRYIRYNCDNKYFVNLPTEDWSFLSSEPEEIRNLLRYSFNVGAFDRLFPGW